MDIAAHVYYEDRRLTNHDHHHLGSVLKLQSPGNLCPVLIFNSCHYEIKKSDFALEQKHQARRLSSAPAAAAVAGAGGGEAGAGVLATCTTELLLSDNND